MRIPFNKPFFTGNELTHIQRAVATGKISGNGDYTKACHAFFAERYGFDRCLLTTSCTDALEMSAILLDIGPGDEVIVPSYTFVSTANAFVLRGAKLKFADSSADHPNLDPTHVAQLITPRTRAIVVVHYAGIACDMDAITALADQHELQVVEDAAQAIDGYYKGRPLGAIGALSAFSFHETKNIIAGEGGMLVVNDPGLRDRAEIIWEKGTNRTAFFRGEVDKYGWVDIGSSFLPSEVTAAFLFSQLEHLEHIQRKRIAIYQRYAERLQHVADETGAFALPHVPEYSTNNAHMFYLVCAEPAFRTAMIAELKAAGILAVFHYISLHSSPYMRQRQAPAYLPQADRYTECLVRLPLYYELTLGQVDEICDKIAQAVATYTTKLPTSA